MSPCIFFICELFHIYGIFCSLFFKRQRLFTKTFAFFTQNSLPCSRSHIPIHFFDLFFLFFQLFSFVFSLSKAQISFLPGKFSWFPAGFLSFCSAVFPSVLAYCLGRFESDFLPVPRFSIKKQPQREPFILFSVFSFSLCRDASAAAALPIVFGRLKTVPHRLSRPPEHCGR